MKRCFLAGGFAALVLAFGWPAASGASLSARAGEVVDRARTKVVVLKTRRPRAVGSGTGFLARPNLVITASHVVTGKASVTAWLNGVAYPAALIENHPQEDLALLRLRAPELQLKPAELADTSEGLPPDAELVILAGPSQGPQADGDPRSRLPIPAAFSRRLPLTDPTGRRTIMLSMRASVRRGDSGSPVLRVSDGRVVGVLSSRQLPDAGGVSHFAYAVPVEAIHAWLDAALDREEEARGDFYLLRLR